MEAALLIPWIEADLLPLFPGSFKTMCPAERWSAREGAEQAHVLEEYRREGLSKERYRREYV